MMLADKARKLFAVAPTLAEERYDRRDGPTIVSARWRKQWLEFLKKAKEEAR